MLGPRIVAWRLAVHAIQFGSAPADPGQQAAHLRHLSGKGPTPAPRRAGGPMQHGRCPLAKPASGEPVGRSGMRWLAGRQEEPGQHGELISQALPVGRVTLHHLLLQFGVTAFQLLELLDQPVRVQ